jgi:hypothetical protein
VPCLLQVSLCVCLGLTQLIQRREYRFAVKESTCNNLPSTSALDVDCCSKIAEAEAAVSVNEKKWLVMHMHVQLQLDELRGPQTLGSL